MRIGVEVRKLHVSTCVYHFKCFSKIKFMDSSNQDVERSGFGSDSLRQYFFDCFLVILVQFL